MQTLNEMTQKAESNIVHEDQQKTLVSLATIKLLDSGKTEDAKKFLAENCADYYVRYTKPVNSTNKISSIQTSILTEIQIQRTNLPELDKAIIYLSGDTNK